MKCKVLDECVVSDGVLNPETCEIEYPKGLSEIVPDYRPEERVIDREIVQLINECE